MFLVLDNDHWGLAFTLRWRQDQKFRYVVSQYHCIISTQRLHAPMFLSHLSLLSLIQLSHLFNLLVAFHIIWNFFSLIELYQKALARNYRKGIVNSGETSCLYVVAQIYWLPRVYISIHCTCLLIEVIILLWNCSFLIYF